MKEELYHVLKKPYISEKMSNQLGESTVIGFVVRADATKFTIKAAVEELLSVKVDSVRTVNKSARKVRFGKTNGQRKAWKKAYVTLKAGESIEQLGAA